jgi:hypothetical protein
LSLGAKHNSSNYDPYNPSSYASQPITTTIAADTNGTSAHNNRDSMRDGDHLAPVRVNNLRHKSSDISNQSGDADSLLELYKAPSNPSMRATPSGPKTVRKVSTGALSHARSNGALAPPEEDASHWIHRDKLAQIESRELIEAGLRVGRRPSERIDTLKKGDEKRQKLVGGLSPESVTGGENDSVVEDAPLSKSFIPKPAGVRGVNSRIPVPKSVSGSYGESPGDARSRSGSAGVYSSSADSGGAPQSPQATGGHEQGDEYDYEKELEDSPPDSPPLRANSGITSTPTTENPPSPQKQTSTTPSSTIRNPKNNTAGRKPPTGTVGARNASASGKARNANVKPQKEEPKRPGTSSGSARPMTSHRTDGEPPWMANMYKPDPRLPPDQQMLPTHARRLAQEQWEKEGKTGTVYDRDFNLLNVNAFPTAPPSPERKKPDPTDERISTTSVKSENKWRESLGSPQSPTSPSARPGTSGTESGGHGGYKTMPSIPPTPTNNMPATPPSVVGAGLQQQIEMQGITNGQNHNKRDEHPRKKESGCMGCGCVIM